MTRPSSRDLLRFFLWLGTTGFGGPIALVGYMEHEFVDRRRWVTRQELSDGLAFSQLAPGPLAAQLAIYLGWLCRGARGATVAGIAFVVPSFAMVLVLAALYQRLGGIAWLQGAFYGIGAAVIAIIARSAVKLARTTLGSDRLMWVLFVASALVTAWTESEVVWVFALCGVVSVMARTSSGLPRRWMAMVGPVVGTAHVPTWLVAALEGAGGTSLVMIGAIFIYFASAGMFVFGSGLAIVPFLHGGVVQQHHWLTERQFLDAVAVALITPGPVVITVAFIGYLVAGPLGGLFAAVGMFLPTYLAVVLAAPSFHRVMASEHLKAAVDGVTAAATGAIAGAVVVLGRRAIVDGPTIAIAIATLLVLTRVRRVPEPLVIIAAGVVGVVLTRLH